jgi:hypothetical protein
MQKHQVDFTGADFQKPVGSWIEACVEVAEVDGTIGFRDSKDQTGPVLRYTKEEFRAFRQGILDGEFDHFAD